MKLKLNFTPYTKITSKLIMDLKHKTIKPLGKIENKNTLASRARQRVLRFDTKSTICNRKI